MLVIDASCGLFAVGRLGLHPVSLGARDRDVRVETFRQVIVESLQPPGVHVLHMEIYQQLADRRRLGSAFVDQVQRLRIWYVPAALQLCVQAINDLVSQKLVTKELSAGVKLREKQRDCPSRKDVAFVRRHELAGVGPMQVGWEGLYVNLRQTNELFLPFLEKIRAEADDVVWSRKRFSSGPTSTVMSSLKSSL